MIMYGLNEHKMTMADNRAT